MKQIEEEFPLEGPLENDMMFTWPDRWGALRTLLRDSDD